MEGSEKWNDGAYLAECGQKLGLRSDKVLQYINKGILELCLDGSINMDNARKRIDKFLKTREKDEETAQNNVAIWNLLTGTRAPAVIEDARVASSILDKDLHTARSMLTKAMSEPQIIHAFIEKKGMTYTEARKIVVRAVASFKETRTLDLEYEVNRAYARFEDLYAMAQKDGDYRSSLVILREFMTTFQIIPAPPKKPALSQEEIEEQGGVVRPQVFVPDNGRDPDFVRAVVKEPEEKKDEDSKK